MNISILVFVFVVFLFLIIQMVKFGKPVCSIL